MTIEIGSSTRAWRDTGRPMAAPHARRRPRRAAVPTSLRRRPDAELHPLDEVDEGRRDVRRLEHHVTELVPGPLDEEVAVALRGNPTREQRLVEQGHYRVTLTVQRHHWNLDRPGRFVTARQERF